MIQKLDDTQQKLIDDVAGSVKRLLESGIPQDEWYRRLQHGVGAREFQQFVDALKKDKSRGWGSPGFP